jgi:hypothetical protein
MTRILVTGPQCVNTAARELAWYRLDVLAVGQDAGGSKQRVILLYVEKKVTTIKQGGDFFVHDRKYQQLGQ